MNNRINSNASQFVKTQVRVQKWKEVEQGKTALILSLNATGGLEEFFINSENVMTKCNHCGNITNKMKTTSRTTLRDIKKKTTVRRNRKV